MNTPDDAMAAFARTLEEHDACTWEAIGPCVYCANHGTRLYQGDLPEQRRTTPRCPDGDHDWDEEMGMGFYILCKRCGFREWCE